VLHCSIAAVLSTTSLEWPAHSHQPIQGKVAVMKVLRFKGFPLDYSDQLMR